MHKLAVAFFYACAILSLPVMVHAGGTSRDGQAQDIASGRVGRCNQKRRTAMNGYPPRKPKSARRVAFQKWAFVGAIAGRGPSFPLAASPRIRNRRRRSSSRPMSRARKDADEEGLGRR